MQFLAGRYCAFKACEKMGFNLTELLVGNNREPLWPDSIVGSISHSKTAVMAIVASSDHFKSVGLDLEMVIPDARFDVIERMVLTELDLKFLKSRNIDKNLFYTIIFSAKEALYKTIYPLVHCYFDFKEASIIDLNLENGSFNLKLHSKLEAVSKFNSNYTGKFIVERGQVITQIVLMKE
jgi:enterobactin synthetase component D